MKIVTKISLSILLVMGVCSILAGIAVNKVSKDFKAVAFRMFDSFGTNLAGSIGNQVRQPLVYFDYAAVDAVVARHLSETPNLLFVRIEYGDKLGQRKEAGDQNRKPFRPYTVDVVEDRATIAKVTIHYSDQEIQQRLGGLVRGASIWLASTIVILLVVISSLVVVFINRNMRHMLVVVREASRGNLNVMATARAQDEFGELATAFNGMIGSLRDMVSRINATFADLDSVAQDISRVARDVSSGSSRQAESVESVSSSITEMNNTIKSVNVTVGELTTLSEESSSSILEMGASVEEVARSADGLSTSVEQTSTSITEMNVSMQRVAGSIEALSGLITDTTSSITQMDSSIKQVEISAEEANRLSEMVNKTVNGEGQEAVRKSIEGVEHIRVSVSQAAKVIQSLGEKSQDIGEILTVIKDVNEQTNLLALNAAIIAAQAGEHGRSFAVVADEIRELSARTAASTKEIARIIQNVQTEAVNAVTAIEEGSKRVEEGVATIREMGRTLDKVSADSERASSATKMIARATAEQAAGIKQVAQSAQTMNQMSKEISRATKEQSAGSTLIMKAAEDMRDLAMLVRRATTEQAEGIRQIGLAGETTHRMSQSILRATDEESKGIEMILENVLNIKDSNDINLEAVGKLDRMVGVLDNQAKLLRKEIERFVLGLHI
jgi:methyl-accepting chemotaxis protein